MANILKSSKRAKWLPRVTNGFAGLGERYADRSAEENERGTMPPMMYTADIWAGTGDERVEYQVQFTEDEVIRIAGDWLSKIASRRNRERAALAKKTARP